MATILNSTAIICLAVAFIIHLVKFHKPIKFEITKEELEKKIELQRFLEKQNKTGEEFSKKTKEIFTNVPTSNRNSESESRN